MSKAVDNNSDPADVNVDARWLGVSNSTLIKCQKVFRLNASWSSSLRLHSFNRCTGWSTTEDCLVSPRHYSTTQLERYILVMQWHNDQHVWARATTAYIWFLVAGDVVDRGRATSHRWVIQLLSILCLIIISVLFYFIMRIERAWLGR